MAMVGVLIVGVGSAAASPVPTDPPTSAPSSLPADTVVAEEDAGLGPEAPSVFQDPALITEQLVVSGPLIPVPPGCSAPAPAVAVFIGVMTARDPTTVRFQIESVRAGSVDGYARGRLIDVRYGNDARFLTSNTRYIVGVGFDDAAGVLFSKVRQPAPLFGGDAVIGLDDGDVVCPRVEDPVRTLTAPGLPVDSGLFAPLQRAKVSIISALLRPLAVGFLILVGLVLLKTLIFAGGRSLRDLAQSDIEPVTRNRRHREHPSP